jgi:hypothetical protein
MGNAIETIGKSPDPAKAPPAPDDADERRRNAVGWIIGIITGVSGLVFELLQFTPPLERALSVLVAITFGGTLVEAIKAWPVIRRYKTMLTCTALTIIILCAMTLTAQSSGATSPAPSPPAPSPTLAPAVTSPANPAPSQPAATATATATSPPPSAASGQLNLEYTLPDFTIQGESCPDDSFAPYVLFAPQGFYSDPYSSSEFDSNSDRTLPQGVYQGGNYDLFLDCMDQQIAFKGKVSSFKGTPTAEACKAQLNSNPILGSIDFYTLFGGMQFCLAGADGNLIYLKLLSVSPSSFTSTWTATVWKTPPSN